MRVFFLCGLVFSRALFATETFIVSTLSDSGNGSLRQAISFANATPDIDTIRFAEELEGSITLSSTLTVTASVEIIGPGRDRLTLDGGRAVRVLELSGGTHYLSSLTIQNGQSDLGGANIRVVGDLELRDCAILNGRATALNGSNNNSQNADGGGLFHSTGNLLVDSSLIQGNSTIGGFSQGGGLYTEQGNATIRNTRIVGNTTDGFVSEGGGVGSRSTMLMENCEVSENETLASSSGGGGIYTDTTITLRQCTISGNTVGATPGTGVEGYSVGGAFASVGTRSATFEHCTITANSAPHGVGQGPGISSLSTGVISFRGCIVAGNIGGGDLDETPNRSLTYRDDGFNLFGIVTNTNLNLTANQDSTSSYGITDPQLSSLDFHGSMTRNHIPLPGSPALDAGLASSSNAFDQRGSEFPRIVGSRSDIGAIERQTFIDSDYDGIPDSVEALVPGLSTSDGDLDNDGISDLREFLILGISAIDDSGLRPYLVMTSEGNDATFSFPHSPAREYRLRLSPDLILSFQPVSEAFTRFPNQVLGNFSFSIEESQSFFVLEARMFREPTE